MKAISIVDNQDDNKAIISQLKKIEDLKIYSMDHIIHDVLEKNQIRHFLGDELLDENLRLKIHQESFEYISWHKNISNKIFEFKGYNMLEIIDENEFQILLTEKLSRLFCVKHIVELENPEKIFRRRLSY